MRVLVVLPTVNEAATIEEVMRKTRAAVADAHILVVDDNSSDGTADLAEKVGEEIGGVDVLRRPSRQGLGTAYITGFRWGLDRGAAALVEMDSDLSHDPGALPELLAPLEDHGLVIGSRYIPGGSVPKWAWYRRLLSSAGNRYSSLMLGLPLHDLTSGYRAYTADALARLNLDRIHAQGYTFQIEMAYRACEAGVAATEVPIRFVDRELGKSKMSGDIIAEALLLVTRWGLARIFKGQKKSPAPIHPLPKERTP
jgi:dolichol-phosphate mannosyltransferase